MGTWNKNVRKVSPYVPGEQPNRDDIIKLNTNENPYPPTPGVIKALQQFSVDKLKLYPEPNSRMLVDTLAQYHNLPADQVFVGVGSDDVLALAFLTFFNGREPILFPDITYSFYDVWAELFEIPYQRIPLDKDFHIIKDDYFIANGGIVIANPNAPTGAVMELADIEEIVAKNANVMVIIDEAYIDFGGESAVSLIPLYDNLLVVRTFSKSRCLAGLRIGYAMAQPQVIKYINNVKHSYNSYTMSHLALALGTAAVTDDVYFKEVLAKITKTRERVKIELQQLGFSLTDSKSNFVFVTHETWKAKELFLALREKNIYVRHFDKPRINNYLRITIGTDAEMDVLIDFFKAYRE
jgi:histidinol-phosphate aminotransferase